MNTFLCTLVVLGKNVMKDACGTSTLCPCCVWKAPSHIATAGSVDNLSFLLQKKAHGLLYFRTNRQNNKLCDFVSFPFSSVLFLKNRAPVWFVPFTVITSTSCWLDFISVLKRKQITSAKAERRLRFQLCLLLRWFAKYPGFVWKLLNNYLDRVLIQIRFRLLGFLPVHRKPCLLFSDFTWKCNNF